MIRLLFLSVLVLAAPLHADEIQELKHSGEVRKLGGKAARPDSKTEINKWFPKNTNFSKVFTDRHGAALLVDWLGSSTDEYKASKPEGLTSPEMALAKRTFLVRSNRKQQFSLQVLVPHPRSALSREMNLLKHFRRLESEYRHINAREEIKVHGLPATVARFEEDDHHHLCGVLIPIAQKGLMEVTMKDCGDAAIVVEFAETLDIPRLTEKLES